MSLPSVVRHYFWWTEEISNNQKVVSNHDFTKSCCMKCNKNPVVIKCYTWEQSKSKLLNSLQLWNQNGNFRKLELIGGLSDQQRQLLCRTDTVFASLGLRSSGLFRRLIWVQVVACCLMAPSHCLNQCWLNISGADCGIHLDQFHGLNWEHQSIKLVWKFNF